GYTGKVRIALSQGAADLADAPAGCTVNGSVLVCDGTGANGARQVQVHLAADDTSADTPVTLTVLPLDGYGDDDLTNNDADVTLTKVVPPTPTTDLRISALEPPKPVPGEDGKYLLTSQLSIAGKVPPSVTFRISGAK